MTQGPPRRFLVLWGLSVAALASVLVLHVGLRVRAVRLGYELGALHQKAVRLEDVKRVLALEVSTYESPARADYLARSLLGMGEPGWDRVVVLPREEPVTQRSTPLEAALASRGVTP